MTWRLIKNKQNNAAMNMAIDESMLLTQRTGCYPTLRVYDWLKPAFSFGYFQRLSDEVDVSVCDAQWYRARSANDWRRHGDTRLGCNLYHHCSTRFWDVSDGHFGAYCAISDCLINGFQRIGIDVGYQIEKPIAGDAPNIWSYQSAQYDTCLTGKRLLASRSVATKQVQCTKDTSLSISLLQTC